MPVGGGGAWPGFETTRRAEGSRRGRLAGGPPPTGTPSSPAQTDRGARNTGGATATQRPHACVKPRPADAGRGLLTQRGVKV